MSEYEYDREFWGEIDKATLKGLKRCATVMFYTMIGVVVSAGSRSGPLWVNGSRDCVKRRTFLD